MACEALSIWLLLRLVNSRTVKSAWLFGASVAGGLLVHPLFVWTMGAPALFSVAAAFRGEQGRESWQWPRQPSQIRFLLLGLIPSGAVFLTIVGSWYLAFGSHLITTYHTLAKRDETIGAPFILEGFFGVEASFLWYAETAPMVLSKVLVLFFVIGVVAAVFSRRFDRWILVISATTSFILLSRYPQLHWMYAAQVLPIVAVLSTTWIVQVRPRWLATSLGLFCLAVGSVNLMTVTFGARFFQFDPTYWTVLRTTNPIERLNKEFKRRTRAMEVTGGEISTYRCLVYVAQTMEYRWSFHPLSQWTFICTQNAA